MFSIAAALLIMLVYKFFIRRRFQFAQVFQFIQTVNEIVWVIVLPRLFSTRIKF